ncbi:MAG: succinate dehydrogenase, partial [Acidobacteria bacterium]
MAGVPTSLPESRLGSTLRGDAWWMEILAVVIVLGGFGAYATLRAFENAYYFWGPYLSPFYSPLID